MREIIVALIKTGSGSAFNLLFGILTTKIFAVYLGPSGIGLYSLIRQFKETLLSVTTLNGGAAIVQGIASKPVGEKEKYQSAVALVILIVTLIASLVIFIFAKPIAAAIFSQDSTTYILLIRLMIFPLILATGIFYLSSILNGNRAIGRLALVQASVSLITLLLAYPTAILAKQNGPIIFLLPIILSTLSAFLLGVFFVFKSNWSVPTRKTLEYISSGAIKPHLAYFLSFATTTLITGFGAKWSILFVRTQIVRVRGLSDAGIFDVAWTLSMMYLTIILTSFGTYYLPTFSRMANNSEKIRLINQMTKLVIPFLVPLITTIIVLKPFIIRLLFSEEFLPAITIINWMLIGDYLKTTSWIFAVTISGSADKKALLVSEALWQIGFLILSIFAINNFYSLEGIGISFMFMYSIYLAFTFIYSNRKFGFIPKTKLLFTWIFGFLIIIFSSILTWNFQTISIPISFLCIGISLGFTLIFLTSDNKLIIQKYIQEIRH